jgi:hypothetical protein
MVGDFWFTCWVDAGQPNLDDLLKNGPTEEELEKEMKEIEALKNTKKVKSRDHDH